MDEAFNHPESKTHRPLHHYTQDPLPQRTGLTEEVLVLIRFDSNVARTYHNTIDSQNGMLGRTYRGQERFFATELPCTSGGDNRKRGLAVIEFERSAKAHEWLISAPQVRQQDWLHGVDILMIPARTPWHPDMKTLEIVSFPVMHDAIGFQEDFLDRLPYPDPHGNGPYNTAAAPDYAMQRVRGNWCPRYLVINQWTSQNEAFRSSFTQGHRVGQFTEIAPALVFMADADIYNPNY